MEKNSTKWKIKIPRHSKMWRSLRGTISFQQQMSPTETWSGRTSVRLESSRKIESPGVHLGFVWRRPTTLETQQATPRSTWEWDQGRNVGWSVTETPSVATGSTTDLTEVSSKDRITLISPLSSTQLNGQGKNGGLPTPASSRNKNRLLFKGTQGRQTMGQYMRDPWSVHNIYI